MPIYTTPARQGTITKIPPIKGEPIKFCCDTVGALTAWSIAGNTKQTGTPTPDNPIMPDFCGVRTWNLYNIDAKNTANGYIDSTQLNQDGTTETWTLCEVTEYIEVTPSTEYVLSRIASLNAPSYCIYDTDKQYISGEKYGGQTVKHISVPSNGKYIRFSRYKTGLQTMLNLGSTALPYEPYGYKIPITCAGQTVPVYLRQTRTVRRVKKLVLTGTEDYVYGAGNAPFILRLSDIVQQQDRDAVLFMCTHYQAVPNSASWSRYSSIVSWSFSGDTNTLALVFRDTSCADLDAFKAYLAAQYAAGTPVTIWYVLATPETAIVNEPLAKIGDYADELHSADAGVTIPTAKGANTLTVETDLQPSSFSITVPDMYPAISKIPIPSLNKEVKHVLDSSGNFVYKSPQYYTWEGIRKIVRAGLAPQYYPLGSIIYDNFDPSTGTAFQVVAYDNHFDPALTAQGYTHSMTLCELLLDDVISMDATEAFLYTNQAIPAGTYKFTIPDYDTSYGGNKTYYFTSTAEIPANSQIVMSWPYNQAPKTITGYAPTASLTAMENATAATGWNALTLTEWVDGTSPAATDLGTIAGPTTQAGISSYGSMNHIHRARYGSNNYLQSGARQYLNSDKAANQWWKPQTIFDRPYGSRSLAGKLTKLSPSFVDVLAKPKIQSRTNQYFETTSLDGTTFSLSTNYNIQTDRLFLLSPMEIGFSTTDTTVGTLMGYYQGATDAKRIKYRKSNGNAYHWWLRTLYPSTARYVRYVNTTGSLSGNYAHSSTGVPAAACIQ